MTSTLIFNMPLSVVFSQNYKHNHLKVFSLLFFNNSPLTELFSFQTLITQPNIVAHESATKRGHGISEKKKAKDHVIRTNVKTFLTEVGSYTGA